MDIKKGDIFEWRYKDEEKHKDYLNYWCCTRIAKATDTHLVDIYWGDNSGSRGVETFEKAQEKWALKFMVNMDDLEKINDWEDIFYHPDDIVNLNHSNRTSGGMYRRKGTKRNREVMIEYAQRCLDGYKRAVDSATMSVKEYEQKLEDIRHAKIDLNDIYLQMPK